MIDKFVNLNNLQKSIEKQRDLIASKLRRLKREDPFATEDRSIIVEPGEDASVLAGHERIIVLEERLKSDLKEIESALMKIKKGTYGKCEKCKKIIDVKRLEVKPHALYCLKCLKEIENKSK